MATATINKHDNTNDRVYGSNDVHMCPQWASIPLQGLDRCILTVITMSSPCSHLDFSIGTISPVVSLQYVVDKKHCGITDQLTLASGGSKHA